MENFSENHERGRPRKYPADMIQHVLDNTTIRSRRGAIEYLLQASAYTIIYGAWALDPKENSWAEFYVGEDGKQSKNQTIMAALGRIDDEEKLLGLAIYIARQGLSLQQALNLIRAWRRKDNKEEEE